jgi:hypothetical protein
VAGISKNYCAKNSGSPEVELRFCPWLPKYLTNRPDLRTYVSLSRYYDSNAADRYCGWNFKEFLRSKFRFTCG